MCNVETDGSDLRLQCPMMAWLMVVMEAESVVAEGCPAMVERGASFLGIRVEAGHCNRARIMEVGVYSKLAAVVEVEEILLSLSKLVVEFQSGNIL